MTRPLRPFTAMTSVFLVGIGSAAAETLPSQPSAVAGDLAFAITSSTPTTPEGRLEDIQACPYAKIRAAYDEAMRGADVLDTLAVEREVLLLCEERNALIARLLTAEAELTELLGADPDQTASRSSLLIAASNGDTAAPTPGVPEALDLLQPGGAGALALDPLEEIQGSDLPAQQGSLPDATLDLSDPGSGGGGPIPHPPEVPVAELTGEPQSSASDVAPEFSGSESVGAAAPVGTLAVGQCALDYATRFVDLGVPAIAGLVETATSRQYTVRSGDMLPGNYRVLRIDASGVTLALGAAELLLPPAGAETARAAEGFYSESGSQQGSANPADLEAPSPDQLALPGLWPPGEFPGGFPGTPTAVLQEAASEPAPVDDAVSGGETLTGDQLP